MNKPIIAGAAALSIMAVLAVGSLLTGDDKDPQATPPSPVPTVIAVPQEPTAKPTESPSTAVSGMPETPGETGSPEETATVDITAPDPALAEQLVTTYYTRSWQDANSRVWLANVKKLGDDELWDELVHEHGSKPMPTEKTEWRDVIMAPKATTRVVDVEVSTDSATDEGHAVFEVEFSVEKMTEKPVADWDWIFSDTWSVEYAWDGTQWLAHAYQVVS